MSKFGPAPPSEDEILRRHFGDQPFVRTGPERWNALGLGSTAMFAHPLVYNDLHAGTFVLEGLRFELRIEEFPRNPPPEWFVVDRFNHADEVGASRADLAGALVRALARGTFDHSRLLAMSAGYGTNSTWIAVRAAIGSAEGSGTLPG